MDSLLQSQALTVLARFRVPGSRRSVQPLGNHGGFSGARLWRVETSLGTHGLRAWPVGGMTAERLQWIHSLMAAAVADGLRFISVLVPTAEGCTTAEAGNRLWELTTWMPGQADFHDRPSPERLTAAARALALLHRTWAARGSSTAICPGLLRRLEAVRFWLPLLRSGWTPPREHLPATVQPWVDRAWRVFPAWLAAVPKQLAPWVQRQLPLQPCLCDIWHDHVLFEGDAVSGIIDYGSAKIDHPAADLARLLGSLVGDDARQRELALRAYAEILPLEPGTSDLVEALDGSGVIVGLGNWLRWLCHDGRSFDDWRAVARRLQELVERITNWQACSPNNSQMHS